MHLFKQGAGGKCPASHNAQQASAVVTYPVGTTDTHSRLCFIRDWSGGHLVNKQSALASDSLQFDNWLARQRTTPTRTKPSIFDLTLVPSVTQLPDLRCATATRGMMYPDPRAHFDRAASSNSDRPFYPVVGQHSNSRPSPPPRQPPPPPSPPAAAPSPGNGGLQNPLLRVQIAEQYRTMPPVSACLSHASHICFRGTFDLPCSPVR